MPADLTVFDWSDPLLLEQQLSASEHALRRRARIFAEQHLAPRVVQRFRSARADPALFGEMGRQGLLGAWLPASEGGSSMGAVAEGLLAREIERVDSGYRSMLCVQPSLVMQAIWRCGSAAQRQQYLPGLASGDLAGCFGLVDGERPLRARVVAGGYVLDGVKRRITNGPLADVLVVWASDTDGAARGFVLRKGMPGLTVPVLHGSAGLRAALYGDIVMEQVFCPQEALLPDGDAAAVESCLTASRYGVAWGALGAAEACWHAARRHALERSQFGQPLAFSEMVQQKLADMQAGIAMALQGCLRLGRLQEEGLATAEMTAMVKRHACATALDAARGARDLIGGNGIDDSAGVLRHLTNLETVQAYEGRRQADALALGCPRTVAHMLRQKAG